MKRTRLTRPQRERPRRLTLRVAALTVALLVVWNGAHWALAARWSASPQPQLDLGDAPLQSAKMGFVALALVLGAIAVASGVTERLLRATLAAMPFLALVPVGFFAFLTASWGTATTCGPLHTYFEGPRCAHPWWTLAPTLAGLVVAGIALVRAHREA